MKVRKAINGDMNEVAKLHSKGIPTGFISSLPQKLIRRLYLSIKRHDILFVMESENGIQGFVSCSLSTGKLYKKFIAENLFIAGILLIPMLFKLSFLRKLKETLKAPSKTKSDNNNKEMPELLSIVIKPGNQGKGLGQILLVSLEAELRNLGVSEYKVIAGEKLKFANKFYSNNGFRLVSQTELHKGEVSNIYEKKLNEA